jgi:CHAD domain-containing protein
MDIPSFAAEQARRRLERLAFQVNSTTRTPNPEAVHELRVVIRRFLQSLTVFKTCFPRKNVKRIRKELKHMLKAAGLVRDHDVAVKILSQIPFRGADALIERFRTGRKLGEKGLVVSLKRWAAEKSLSKWCNGLELGAPHPFSGNLNSLARSTLSALGKKFSESGEQAAAPGSSSEELHDFRILVKKFRYTLELFAPVYASRLEQPIGRIKEIQSLLGAINDYHTVRTMSDLSRHGKLQAELRKSHNQRIKKFRKLWAGEFSGPKVTRQWLADFDSVRQPPRKPVARARRTAARTAVAARA